MDQEIRGINKQQETIHKYSTSHALTQLITIKLKIDKILINLENGKSN